MTSLSPVFSIRAGAMALAVVAVGLVVPEPASAQRSDPEGDIRVIETVDPVSGARYRQTLYDLSEKEIRTVQRALREAGYLGVGWTGRLDPGTVRALDELQEERGLYRCGCVSYETIIALSLTPIVEATTVAVGGAGAYGSADPYRYGYRAGILYPVAVPILVPGAPDGPAQPGSGLPADGATAVPEFPPSGPVPPGVRPLPPPTRIFP